MSELDQGRGDVDPRVTFALERTLLAWTRTALALMGFGFVVGRLGLLIPELDRGVTPGLGQSRWVGVGLVGLGAFVQIMGLASYAQRVKQLRSGESISVRLLSPASLLGAGLVIIAVVVSAYLATVQ